ncbi:hypothetical protein [Legionella fallonii]|uniref:Uncharacterized protein n=1 Tax=Legionella fallonii LLAP-10 TaxID=1212491 RepID=A0A098G3D4_9GAMM|nr:hypothetical protein [Legionella fallonii]CEG56987.1 conserved protein of unknown function [Legionella fallonii LLAP-10]
MKTISDVSKTLNEDKKRLVIERYLREKYKEQFNPLWLNTTENYANLAAAIDFFHQLNLDQINLGAIGSDNIETQKDYAEQFKSLVTLLDKLVVFTGDNPPIATSFKGKEAILESLKLNQAMGSRSLRDIHAQVNNLGVAEKLLNEELGQTEWLGEVDLERMLIKLGVKDRTHITRLNSEDIGMILHFERIKHHGETEPYTIPLLLNCGSSGSLRSQGAHWTYATVTVNPTANSISIDYHDSRPLSEDEEDILRGAIDYTDGQYTAFPGCITKEVNVETDGLQDDGWSCGYRALRGLLASPLFPVDGGVNAGHDWLRLVNTNIDSYELRNSVYQILLSDLHVDEDYFIAMNLDREMLKESSKGYELDSEFTQHYLELLTQAKKKNELITTELFTTEYNEIIKQLSGKKIDTERLDSLKRLNEGMKDVQGNKSLSSDAKIIALLDVFANEYALIQNTSGGSNSGLGKFIKSFCEEQFGVELSKDKKYRLKSDGLMMRIFNAQNSTLSKTVEEESLLPPTVKKVTLEPKRVSQSAPLVERTVTVKPNVSPSVDSIRSDGVELGTKMLRKKSALSRVGTMFGNQQFCYAEKPGGVEPGFRAVDLNEEFFIELDKILSDENLLLESTQFSTEDKSPYARLKVALAKEDLPGKQRIFARFINFRAGSPHEIGNLNNGITWLCQEVKGAVDKNKKLSAWMYKLDYAEGEKDRLKGNKEALREFVGTRFAGIFSSKNQNQEVAWVRGPKGFHAVLACGWKQGLVPLKNFLYGGNEPDYSGVLVDDKSAPNKYSKYIPGLGRNLILGVAIGDRDGMGKEAQNKGIADGAFYGFDYGKTYDGEGVCATVQDDFSFEDKYAKYPAVFRGSQFYGLARHYMYRNYSVFYDTDLSERMFGLHLMRKMITGENPSEDIIKSYPGLRHELNRIQESTPSPKELLNQLTQIRTNCKDGSAEQRLVDTYMMQISSGKLSHFDRYFAQIKIEIIEEAIKNNMPYSDIDEYMTFIDGMSVTAAKNNQAILNVFEQRALLTRQEIDLIDRLEKIYSPTSAMSPDGTVFLNTLRFDPLSSRIPFQLKRELDGTYTLSTSKSMNAQQLGDDFEIDWVRKDEGLSCNVTPKQLIKIMDLAETKYHEKRNDLLVKPTYYYETLPRIISLMNEYNPSEAFNVGLGFAWLSNGSLSLRIVPKTEQQVILMQELFGKVSTINEAEIVEVPPESLNEFRCMIEEAYDEMLQIQLKGKTKEVSTDHRHSGVELEMTSVQGSKWDELHRECNETTAISMSQIIGKEANKLIKRYEGLVSGTTFTQIKDAIGEISDINLIQKLLTYNDKTLTDVENINAIVEERIGDVNVVEEELVVTHDNSSTQTEKVNSNLSLL